MSNAAALLMHPFKAPVHSYYFQSSGSLYSLYWTGLDWTTELDFDLIISPHFYLIINLNLVVHIIEI